MGIVWFHNAFSHSDVITPLAFLPPLQVYFPHSVHDEYNPCYTFPLQLPPIGNNRNEFFRNYHPSVMMVIMVIMVMITYQTDPRIDEYIATLAPWQQHICRQVRDLVHAADSDVTETIKRTNRPYFTLNGNICALLGAKDHLNIFIYDPIAPDPEGIINQGQGNQTARAIQVHQGESINLQALLNLFKAIIANNRAGGWRKLV